MARCDRCDRDHPEMMDGDHVKMLGAWDKEIESIIDKIVSDNSLHENHLDRQNMRVSFIDTLAAKLIARAAIIALEHVEETTPLITSGEQLAHAFSMVTSDVFTRLQGIYGSYATTGSLPDLGVLPRELAEKESATVH